MAGNTCCYNENIWQHISSKKIIKGFKKIFNMRLNFIPKENLIHLFYTISIYWSLVFVVVNINLCFTFLKIKREEWFTADSKLTGGQKVIGPNLRYEYMIFRISFVIYFLCLNFYYFQIRSRQKTYCRFIYTKFKLRNTQYLSY